MSFYFATQIGQGIVLNTPDALPAGDGYQMLADMDGRLYFGPGVPGSGEANRGENVGSGVHSWYVGMSGVNLQFKTFNVANGLSVSDVGNTIGLGFDLDYQPLGTGEPLIDFQVSPGNELKVKSLTSSNSSVAYSSNANEVDLVVTAASVGAASESDFTNHTGNANIHFADAPADGSDYVRMLNTWVAKTIGDVFSPVGQVGGNNIVLFDISDPDGRLIRDSGVTMLTQGAGTLFLADDGTYRSVPSGGEANTQSNQGAGAAIGLAKNGVDLPLRTLISGDASVTFTEQADTLDIRATGAGGGEANRGENLAGTGSQVYAGMNGVNLTFRRFQSSDNSVVVTENASDINLAATAASVGADPAGTATAEVAAHDADAGAHGGVELAFSSHVANGAIHVDHTTVSITAGDGLTGGGSIDATRTINASYGGSGGDFGVATTLARSDHLHSQYLTQINQDPNPILGGNLQTKGSDILLTRSDDSVQGLLTAMDTATGAALVYSADGLAYDPNDGAVTVKPGSVNVFGTNVSLSTLQHSVAGGRQVYVSESGALFGVDPPDPGWIVTDTDDGDYDLGTGDTAGPTVEITGLSVAFGDDVSIGDRVDVSVSLYVHLGKNGDPTDLMDKSSSIEIGFGVNGTHAGNWPAKVTLSPYFTGFITVSFFFQATANYTTSDVANVFCRRGAGEDSACNPWVYGTGNPGALDHEIVLSVPGSGGGGGTGDVTGPGVSVAGNLASYLDTTGKIIADSGVASSELVTGDGSVAKVVGIGRAAYDALSPPDANTTYLINGP